MKFEHQPVLLEETIELLDVRDNRNYVDGTIGGGGHALEILKRNSPKGLLLGIDRDPAALDAAEKRLSEFSGRVFLSKGNYRNIKKIVHDKGFNNIHGILLDLGVSSYQLLHPQRGFSFQGSAPLDMRMGEGELTAAEIVNQYEEERLADLFYNYGDERFSRQIAAAIVKDRQVKKIETTDRLVAVIDRVYAKRPKPKKIHPSTKVFQALRMEVNDELGGLKEFLPNAMDILEPGGRLVIITFHSLEDRMVKEFFKERGRREKRDKYAENEKETRTLEILTKKPITAGREEASQNPRSRSAKLRAAQKI